MTGREFYKELLRTRPVDARRVVFLTGGVVNTKVADFLASVPNLCVEKPFKVEELRSKIQQLLSEPRRS